MILTLIFLLLPLVWFFTDPRSLKERIQNYFKLKSMLFLIAEILLVVGTLYLRPWIQTPIDHLINIFGQVIFLAGIILSVWAKITMKSNWNMPGEYHQRQKEIVKNGPFKFSRNPIYVGLILVILGYCLALRSYTFILVPFIALYFYKAILKEEKILTKHFGKEYLEYKSKVGRFF